MERFQAVRATPARSELFDVWQVAFLLWTLRASCFSKAVTPPSQNDVQVSE